MCMVVMEFSEIIAQVVTKNQSLKGGPILEVNPGIIFSNNIK